VGDAALRARALEGHCLALTGAVESLLGRVAAAAGGNDDDSDNDRRETAAALREAVAQVRAALADPSPLSQPQQQCGQKGVGVGGGSANMLDEAVAALTQRVAAWAGGGDDGQEGAVGRSQPQEEQEEGEQVEAVGSGDR
jgi:hypothetical protein